MQHAVADEAVTDARDDCQLANLLRQLHDRGEYVFGGCLAAYDFQQAHDVRGAEEVQSHYVRRAGV